MRGIEQNVAIEWAKNTSTAGRPKQPLQSMPLDACPPGKYGIQSLMDSLKKLKDITTSPYAVYFGEDWTTGGDWCERYGRRLAVLCAMGSPRGNHEIMFDSGYRVYGMIGPHHNNNDGLRHWVHWVKANDNYRVLYTPTAALRRQAEWDDHGEAYSMSHDGPDLWVVLRTPPGQHVASFYFYNKDGHSGNNRFRDYLIEVRHLQTNDTPESNCHTSEEIAEVRRHKLNKAILEPVLSRARVKDFWGGVYKSFVLSGNGTFYIRIARNGSFNTILSGVFLDKLIEPDNTSDRKQFIELNYSGVSLSPVYVAPNTSDPDLMQIMKLWSLSKDSLDKPDCIIRHKYVQCIAYRAAIRSRPDDTALTYMRWNLKDCHISDRINFWDTMMCAWSRRQDRCVAFRSKLFMPNSPNVINYSIAQLEEMQNANVDWTQYLRY